MNVDPVAVNVPSVNVILPLTVHVPAPVVIASVPPPVPVKSMLPVILTVGVLAAPVTVILPSPSASTWKLPLYVCVPAPSTAL